jgi:hypothetical protein
MRNPFLFAGSIAVALLIVLIPVSSVLAAKGDTGFNAVVNAIEGRYQVHASRVPLMGLVNLVARGATHGGASHMHIAEIENFSAAVDGEELTALVEQHLVDQKDGDGWQRIVRETHRKGADESLIYVRPEGERMGMFIVDKEGQEMDIVELTVNPDALNETIHKYAHGRQDPDERD